jgi:hypothetical protein
MNEYIQVLLNAFFVGIGSAFGAYLANKHLIDKLETSVKKINKVLQNGKRDGR